MGGSIAMSQKYDRMGRGREAQRLWGRTERKGEMEAVDGSGNVSDFAMECWAGL